MKKLLPVTIVLSLILMFSQAALATEQGPAQIKLPSKKGVVNFDHAQHQQRVSDCVSCHHAGLDAGSCKSCHGVNPDAPKTMTAYHNLCKDCHKQGNGPTKCSGCHVK